MGLRETKTVRGKKNKFSKSGPDNKYVDNKEARWCGKCKVRHAGKCNEVVTFYKCGKTSHYANKHTSDQKLCFECGEVSHFKDDCPKKKEGT